MSYTQQKETEDEKHPVRQDADASKYVKTNHPLYRFIKDNGFLVGKKVPFTHTNLGGAMPACSFNIPDDRYDEFMDLYIDNLNYTTSAAKTRLCITEKHKSTSPVLIDLDFRLADGKSLLTSTFIVDFVEKLFGIMQNYIELCDTTDAYILIKNIRYDMKENGKGYYKDGIHIVIPGIVTTPSYQYKFRERFISFFPDFFTELSPLQPDADKVYDYAVIKDNNWLMYGSMKSYENAGWYVGAILKVDALGKVQSREAYFNHTDSRFNLNKQKEFVRTLSIRKPLTESKYKEMIEPETPHRDDTRSMASEALTSISNVASTLLLQDDDDNDPEFICKLVDCLSVVRANGYGAWRQLGWCLKNIDASNIQFLDKWIEFSKKSPKFTSGECERLWATRDSIPPDSKDALKIGSLIKWAREDDPEAAQQIEQEYYLRKANLDANATLKTIMRSGRLVNYNAVKVIFERKNFKINKKTCYACEEENGTVTICDRTSFRERYRNIFCCKREARENKWFLKKVRFIDEWIDDGMLRSYETIDFLPPPLACPEDVFNLWSGFAIDKINVESSGIVEPFLKHLKVLVKHNQAHFDYFIKWLAQIVQQPGKLVGIAVVLISKEGSGKNRFLDTFSEMLGLQYYFETACPEKDLFGRFCNGRVNKLLINIDEAKSKDTFAHSDEVKNMITSLYVNYEQKGVDAIQLRNFNRFLFTSNNIMCVKVENGGRRFVIFECSNELYGNQEYFDKFTAYMSNVANQKAIMDFLRSVDLSTVRWIADRPESDLYSAMQQQCAEPHVKFFESIYLRHQADEHYSYRAKELLEKFRCFLKNKLKIKDEAISAWNDTRFGLQLKALMLEYPNAIKKVKDSAGRMKYDFNNPELEILLKKYGLLTELSMMFIDDDDDDGLEKTEGYGESTEGLRQPSVA